MLLLDYVQALEKFYASASYILKDLFLLHGILLASYKARRAFVKLLAPLSENEDMFYGDWTLCQKYYFARCLSIE